jgi:hypothetical protein
MTQEEPLRQQRQALNAAINNHDLEASTPYRHSDFVAKGTDGHSYGLHALWNQPARLLSMSFSPGVEIVWLALTLILLLAPGCWRGERVVRRREDVILQVDGRQVALHAARRVRRTKDRQDSLIEDLHRVGLGGVQRKAPEGDGGDYERRCHECSERKSMSH